MVVPDDRHRIVQAAEVGHDVGAVGRMPFDRVVLVLVEPRRLRENAVRDGDLPDVVEEAAESNRVEPVARQAQLFRDRKRDALHACRVAGRVGVLRVDRRIEALDRFE